MTEHELDVIKRSIEVQLDEYEHSVREAQAWWRVYCERNKLFRAVKRQTSGASS